MKSKKKLDILEKNYLKLDEGWKDFIQELTQNLADIHGKVGFLKDYGNKRKIQEKSLNIYSV
jgi:hypothetical protein